jgi:hypothetical protein
MTKETKRPPITPQAHAASRAARKEARLAKALRANIARRKEQARARASGENANGDPASNPPESSPGNPGKPPRSA